jgi:hypothetical protein
MVDAFKAEPMATPLWTADDGIGGNGRAEDRVVADGPFAMWPLKCAEDAAASLAACVQAVRRR